MANKRMFIIQLSNTRLPPVNGEGPLIKSGELIVRVCKKTEPIMETHTMLLIRVQNLDVKYLTYVNETNNIY